METRRNLLIACEGTTTEPQYFHELRDYVNSKDIKYTIVIKPKPPAEIRAENEAALAINPPARPGARRRQIKQSDVAVNEQMVEEEYHAQPIRYVREAQLGLLDGTFDEAWAIFDQDGHPQHPEAFALAVSDPANLVHIGFSSISFEHWLLLHFEYSSVAFEKSECRRQREIFNCGQHIHPEDCYGANCVSGYMKEKNYILPQQNIKEVGYNDLAALTNTALINAFALRRAQIADNPQLAIYEMNPITTVDKLVLKLLKEPFDLVWKYSQPIIIRHLNFRFEIRGQQLNLTIINDGTAAYILQAGDFILIDVIGNVVSIFERFIADPQAIINKRYNLSDLEDFEPIYIGFKVEENKYSILEITSE